MSYKRSQEEIAEIQAAKLEGTTRGKEELTKEKFEKIYTPLSSKTLTDSVFHDAETSYYLLYPDILTLRELAKKMMEEDSWG